MLLVSLTSAYLAPSARFSSERPQCRSLPRRCTTEQYLCGGKTSPFVADLNSSYRQIILNRTQVLTTNSRIHPVICDERAMALLPLHQSRVRHQLGRTHPGRPHYGQNSSYRPKHRPQNAGHVRRSPRATGPSAVGQVDHHVVGVDLLSQLAACTTTGSTLARVRWVINGRDGDIRRKFYGVRRRGGLRSAGCPAWRSLHCSWDLAESEMRVWR